MVKVATARLVSSALVVVVVSFVAFVFFRALPASPARSILGPFATEEAVANLEKQMNLDEPLYVQYETYVSQFLQGDWGFSYTTGQPARTAMLDRFPATLELALFGFLFATGAAVSLALACTYRRRPALDGTSRAISSVGLATPPFWLGLIALLVFSEWLGIFPGPEGRLSPDQVPPPTVTGLYTVDAVLSGQPDTFLDAAWHLVLPAVVLGFVPFAFLFRILRNNLLDVSREPYIVAARSKGLRAQAIVIRHSLPNAVLPTLTVAGIAFADLITASVLVEAVFEWPGIGGLVTQAILEQDYAVAQTFVLFAAIVYVGASLVVDVLYGAIDPRTRRELAQ
jgi:peptide/nickel transport system permease protein